MQKHGHFRAHGAALASALFFCFAVLLSAPLYSQAAPGLVLGSVKTAGGLNGFNGPISDFDFLGQSVALIGDVDGAGPSVAALAVGALGDDDGGTSGDYGAVWILFLDGSGSVIAEQKIGRSSGGLTGPLDTTDSFGVSVAALGDLDGDGKLEIAVGANRDDDNGGGGGGDRGAVYILSLNTDGTVAAEQKISADFGGFGGLLNAGDRFGSSVALLGDQDGDGKSDIAVGASLDNDGGTDRGAVWILFLDTDGTVLGQQKISATAGAFAGLLANGDHLGASLASLGDLDGNGSGDLVVGADGDDDGGGTGGQGAAWVLFLDSAGMVVGEQKISATAGGFGGLLDAGDAFGSGVAAVGDLNGDLVNDIVVGAQNDDDGATNSGAVWVLLLNPAGTVASEQKISFGSGGMPAGQPLSGSNFGSSVAPLGDFDGDGVFDLLVGARFDSTGGSSRGAAFELLLDGTAIVCGDGTLGFGEDCDDGGNLSGDCCDTGCRFESAGSSCTDGDMCNGDEACDGAGTCNPGTALNCDDGEPCTADTCDALSGCLNGPATTCFGAAKTSFQITDKADDSKDKLKWKWNKGDETLQSDLGDPLAVTTYRLCVFDEVGGVPAFVAGVTVPPNGAWQDKTPKGFQYKDKARTFDGVDKIKLKPGVVGKSKAQLSAKGVNLGGVLPGPAGAAYFQQDTRVIVQLRNEPESTCWTSEFSTFKRNDGERFKAKTP